MTETTVKLQKNPGCLLQILWFAFIGIWLGQAWMFVAWFFMVTIIGIPIGVMMLNMLPKVIALREPSEEIKVSVREDGSLSKTEVVPEQVNIILPRPVLHSYWLVAQCILDGSCLRYLRYNNRSARRFLDV